MSLQMKLVNTLFSLGKGGLEQVMLDYSKALIGQGHEIHVIYQPGMPYQEYLYKMPVVHHHLYNDGPWDLRCALRLNRLLNKIQPDAVFAHGNRSLDMLFPRFFFMQSPFPVIGVAANFKLKRFKRVDGACAHTRQQKHMLKIISGLEEERIFFVPNMIELSAEALPRTSKRSIPVIGAMGRFVEKKGFHHFLNALAELKRRGVEFRAILAGDGKEDAALKSQAAMLGLQNIVTFPGWIEQKLDFYNAIDIFCLPSTHEPFGIVLLEAMSYHLPIVSTDSEGPTDFLHHNKNAIIVPKGNPTALADALGIILKDSALANALGYAGFMLVKERFTHATCGPLLTVAAETIVKSRKY